MEPSTGSTKVFIGHLPMDCTTTDIEAIMGTLEWPEEVIRRSDIRLVRDRETDKFKGFCYVDVGCEERAQQLVGLDGADFGGRRLKIDLATPKVDSRRGGRGGRGGFGGSGRGGFRGGRGGEGSVRAGGEGGRGGGEGGRGGGRGGHRDRRNSDRRPRTSEGEPNNNNGNMDEMPSKPAGRPRLQLKPRTTDPAELEAKKQREAEEEEARKARLFQA